MKPKPSRVTTLEVTFHLHYPEESGSIQFFADSGQKLFVELMKLMRRTEVISKEKDRTKRLAMQKLKPFALPQAWKISAGAKGVKRRKS